MDLIATFSNTHLVFSSLVVIVFPLIVALLRITKVVSYKERFYVQQRRVNELASDNAALRKVIDIQNLKLSTETFSKQEIDVLIRLCHPDKHGGKQSAVEMTQKLLSLR